MQGYGAVGGARGGGSSTDMPVLLFGTHDEERKALTPAERKEKKERAMVRTGVQQAAAACRCRRALQPKPRQGHLLRSPMLWHCRRRF